jgi:hypothetical protein
MTWMKTIVGVGLVLWSSTAGSATEPERRSGRRPIDPGPYIGEPVTPIRKEGTYL